MVFSFRLVVETTQTKDAMGRFFQQSPFSNPVHRTGVSRSPLKILVGFEFEAFDWLIDQGRNGLFKNIYAGGFTHRKISTFCPKT
jgi:hypothetical protein